MKTRGRPVHLRCQTNGGGLSHIVILAVSVGIEVIVFTASGMKCPLTTLARKYGATKGYAFDTFLPESIAKRTFLIFGLLLALGIVLHALRLLRLL